MLRRPARFETIGVAILALTVVAGASFAEYRADQHKLEQRVEALTNGSVARGKQAFSRYGCGSCHTASGVPQATAKVGPPLTGIAVRAIIGGRLKNTPDNLRTWIEHPQAVSPGTAMPDLGVTPQDSRDLAAFLYTQT